MSLRCVTLAQSGKITTAVELTTTINQQIPATDVESPTVTADITTVTDSQTQTNNSYTQR